MAIVEGLDLAALTLSLWMRLTRWRP